MKKILIGIVAFILFCAIPFSVAALVVAPRWAMVEVLNVWSVTSNKKMTYSGTTKYSSQVTTAVGKWNGHISGVISKKSSGAGNVVISDVSVIGGNTAGRTTFKSGTGRKNSTVVFATTVMDSATAIQRAVAVTLEFGHTLGLAESTMGTLCVMHPNAAQTTSNNNLCNADRANYTYMYNNKY